VPAADATRPGCRPTSQDVAHTKPLFVRDTGWAGIVGMLYGGLIHIGFAFELAASTATIGALAANARTL
jgi:hypothetical protein